MVNKMPHVGHLLSETDKKMKHCDVIIIGAGAAALSAARELGVRGRNAIILEMGSAPARKVMASGGGRCNITNMAVAHNKYFGENPDFVRGALSRVKPTDILEWMQSHNLSAVEKAAGQYFCATGAGDVVRAMLDDIKPIKIQLNTAVESVVKTAEHKLIVHTNAGDMSSDAVIVATGGISFPALGVSDIGYKIAKSFGHKIVPPRPALCAISTSVFPNTLAGIATPAAITINGEQINDSLLFTHFGLGGPAIYRATVRNNQSDIHINLMPKMNAFEILRKAKKTDGCKSIAGVLSAYIPSRLAHAIVGDDTRNIADIRDSELQSVATRINDTVIKCGEYKYHGLQSAEVVRGGISTNEISSKTMESKIVSGLFFAGEVIDIAGDLGGFNLHWAWASGTVAGQNA